MTPPRSNEFVGRWAWLFPAIYLVHIAEEFWAPPTFYAWASEFAGVPFSAELFLVANSVFISLMVLAVALALRCIWSPWVVLALATVLGLNGVLHLLGTAVSRSYSPGLVSGMLLYLPLAGVVLIRGARELGADATRRGVVAGLVAHALVPVVGFTLSTLFHI